LIIDPPTDITQRFRLGSQVAALFTGMPEPTPLALLQTVPGGLAHIRIGDHFLDVYSQGEGAVIHMPALGIICGGDFGSDVGVPSLASNSEGSDELDTLRLLARLVKQHRLALYLPHYGSEIKDKVVVMERLAADVAYLHALRRVITPLALRGESIEAVYDLAENVIPRERRTPYGLATHRSNVSSLLRTLMG
jgi:hypothetical protein